MLVRKQMEELQRAWTELRPEELLEEPHPDSPAGRRGAQSPDRGFRPSACAS